MHDENSTPNNLFFFDSYALMELVKVNPAYTPYQDATIVTTKLNLFEVFYALLKNVGLKKAKEVLEKYWGYIQEYDQEVMENAALYKISNKKQRMSMTDCIGYSLAHQLGVPFLTGDKEFERKENVEFVK